MERIHQMNVVPDVLPSLRPSFDLRLTFPEPPPQSLYLRTRSKRQHKQVEPGVFLVSEQVRQCDMFPSCPWLFVDELSQTRKQPTLYASVFHQDIRLYTLLMLDPGMCSCRELAHRPNLLLDVPDSENQSFTTYLHWFQSVFITPKPICH